MTKEEAINAMRQGKKVTHQYFSKEEYIFFGEDGNIHTEDNASTSLFTFFYYRPEVAWATDWEIYKPD
jgi:hypothetical protein